jgi:hypothetical protein
MLTYPHPPTPTAVPSTNRLRLRWSDACRIVIQLRTKDVPGNPQLRHIKVTNAFLQERVLTQLPQRH